MERREVGQVAQPPQHVVVDDHRPGELAAAVDDPVPDRVDLADRAAHLRQQMQERRLAARAYTREYGEDDPEIRDWTWPG